MSKKIIPTALYTKILANFPIPCVDIIVIRNKQFLLGKRKNKPAQGKWWLPGGRLHKNETVIKAAERKVKEETGLRIKNPSFLAVEDTFFKDGRFGTTTHTVNIVFAAKTNSKKLKLDKQHSDLKWFSGIDKSWEPYVQKMLYAAGFK
jgi:colanic acid biosynthesis protein WcaH